MNQIYNGFETDSAAESEQYDQVYYTQEEAIQNPRADDPRFNMSAPTMISSEESSNDSIPCTSGPLSNVLSYLGEKYAEKKSSLLPSAVAPRLVRVEDALSNLASRAHLADYVSAVDTSLDSHVMKPANEYLERARPLFDEKVVRPASEYYSVGRTVVDEKLEKVKTVAQDLSIVKAALPLVEKARTVVFDATAPLEDEDKAEADEQQPTGIQGLRVAVPRVTNRLRKRAFAKLASLHLAERAEKLHHISLIDYAKHNIDNGKSYAIETYEARVRAPVNDALTVATERVEGLKETAKNRVSGVVKNIKGYYAEKGAPIAEAYSKRAGVLFSSAHERVVKPAEEKLHVVSTVGAGYMLATRDLVHTYAERVYESRVVKNVVSKSVPYVERASEHLKGLNPYFEKVQQKVHDTLEKYPTTKQYVDEWSAYISSSKYASMAAETLFRRWNAVLEPAATVAAETTTTATPQAA